MGTPPVICDADPEVAAALLAGTGGAGPVFTDLDALRDHLIGATADDTIVLGPNVNEAEAFALADHMRVHRPSVGVVLVRTEVTTPLLQDALRAGVREVVDARDTAGLSAAVLRSNHLASVMRDQTSFPPPELRPEPPAARGQVVTVFSAKGGCGKTTLATNLGAALADRGRRQVCVLDLDLTFGDVAIAMALFPAHTLADAVPLDGAVDESAVQAMLTHHSPGLSALVAPTEPTTGESVTPDLVGRLLEVLRAEFDYVVVDTPPAFDDRVLAALDVSDLVTLILTPDLPALKNLKIAVETLEELGYPRDRFRLVLNRADTKVGLGMADIEKVARLQVGVQIPSSRDVPAAVNRGVLIVQDDPKHPVTQAIRAFAESTVATGLAGPAVQRGAPAVQMRAERRGLTRRRKPRTT